MADKKSILYISYDCITEPLSASQVLPYLKILSAGRAVYLLTFNKKKISADELDRIGKSNGLRKIFDLKYHKRPSLLATAFDILCGAARSLWIIKKYGISLIHARSYPSCAIALAVKKISGTPYLFDIRGLLADERVDSGDWKKGSITYKIVKFYERVMLKNADHIVVLSRRGARILKEIINTASPRGEAGISVIPTCVDTELFAASEDYKKGDEALRLIYVGSLGTWYMLDEMLDFFKVAVKKIRNLKFLILTPSDPAAVFNIIKKKGIDPGSIEITKDRYERVPRHIGRSSASIFFIRPTFSKMASCPTKFAESLSMGVPVIANAGIGDVDYFIKLRSVGVVVKSFKEEEYERAALELAALMGGADGLPGRCRALAIDEFSLSSGAMKYERIYESI